MPSNQYKQEESIYNLIPQEKVIPPKPPRFDLQFFLLNVLIIKENNLKGMSQNSKRQLERK